MIHLIRSPYKTDSICPPINLLALAGYLESRHQASLTDLVIPYVRNEMSLDGAGLKAAAQRILENPAPVLGFTSMCSSFAAAVRIAEECRRQDPTRKIVFGGPHVSFVAAEALKAFDCIDVVVMGEGEGALLELLDAYKEDRPYDSIANIAYRKGSEIVQTARRPVIADMDTLPLPAFHLVQNIDDYYSPGTERFIEIEAGRGCPFDCNFCSTSLFFSRKYRVKSPARLMAEIHWLRENWDIHAFGLIHDNLTSNKDKVRDFCQHVLDSGESFQWFCSSRTDTIDRPLMEIMKQSGCQGIFFGVETGSQQMQRIMGKRLKMHRVRQTFSDLLEVGISGTASFIIGFPEEKPEDLEQTLALALALRALGVRDVQLHPLSPLPGTRILDEHEPRMVFEPYLLSFQDITSVIELTEVETRWIEQHRRIFSNFYALPPLEYPLEQVYRVRGSYFNLIHDRPFTLSALALLGKVSHLEIVGKLVSKLPGDYKLWTAEVLLAALEQVIADAPSDISRVLLDVFAYEKATTATAEFTSGDNGWVRYKGLVATQAQADDVRLKPCRTLELEHDVLSVVHALQRLDPVTITPRRHYLAIVFEQRTQRLRTLEVDALTALIISRAGAGEPLLDVLGALAEENPYAETEAQRQAWIVGVLEQLAGAGLVIEPAAEAEEEPPAAPAPRQCVSGTGT